MLSKDANPLLQKTAQQIEAKIPPQLQSAFKNIIIAGEKVMYGESTRAMTIKQLQGAGDAAHKVGEGVAKLYALLMKSAKGPMPAKASIPAITVLLCEALDFAEKAKLLTVDENTLAEAMQAMASGLMQLMGVDQNKLNLMMEHAQSKSQPQPQPAAPVAQPAPQPAGLVAQAQGVAQ